MSNKEDERSKNIKRFALGAAIAAAAGYAAGILTAPKSGKETRADIQQKAIAGKVEAEKQLKKLHTQLNSSISEAKDRASDLKGRAKTELDDAADKAMKAKEKARDILSALHEGDADDKDLSKAVKEAQVALEHLKAYLKKDFGQA
jgi:gas vesicle protein